MLLIIDRPVEVPLRRSASAGRALKKRPGAKAWVDDKRLTPLPSADDDSVPTEYLYCRVRAKDPRSNTRVVFGRDVAEARTSRYDRRPYRST